MPGAWLLLLWASPSWAHVYPMKPVVVDLKVEDGRVAADVTADSVYWIEEILGVHNPPPENWDSKLAAKAKDYVNSHFGLKADGAALTGRLVDARFIQRPWEITEHGTIRLRVLYPAVPRTAMLTGSATFYYEYLDERLGMGVEPKAEAEKLFTTRLRAGRRTYELTPAWHEFSFPAADAASSLGGKLLESFWTGAETAPTPEAALLILTLIWLGAGPPWVVLASLAAGFAGGLLLRLPLPLAGLAALTAGGAGLAGRRVPWAAAFLYGAHWARGCAASLPDAAPRTAYFALFWLGAAAAAAVVALASRAAVSWQSRTLRSFSEMQAEDIERRRRWIACLILTLVGAYETFGQFLR